ncbi:dephospho-CoA kinase [Muriicola jejuensis]|uniref:Dephospho-CoA kinase n=1 Tax=Muriicola jejuensis TaxID=504488 RepID=A0A6P0UCQ6_9FLAO|nr:dephospho-CoA kinase [Muriicola jejuensis]NER11071.1 dephospho-CoA kinase [Muriicola jejuensis]SMP23383.1 dephospho-CoA kinase [Muriicola jejuensis]
MKKVGLTGGIGSGKTTVARMFQDLGVPVYNSDAEARRLMNQDVALKEQIIGLLGKEAYREGELDRPFVAGKVFGDKKLLKSLNSIVHPAVRSDFKAWAARQDTPYVLQEAAILFENGSGADFDHMILVTAPKKVRIRRIIDRDGHSETAIVERMKHQWPEKRKKALADFVIENTDLQKTRNQVLRIHGLLTHSESTPKF